MFRQMFHGRKVYHRRAGRANSFAPRFSPSGLGKTGSIRRAIFTAVMIGRACLYTAASKPRSVTMARPCFRRLRKRRTAPFEAPPSGSIVGDSVESLQPFGQRSSNAGFFRRPASTFGLGRSGIVGLALMTANDRASLLITAADKPRVGVRPRPCMFSQAPKPPDVAL